MVSGAAFWCVALFAALGWGCFTNSCFTLQALHRRIDQVKRDRGYWRDRATRLQSELLDRVPQALVDPEGARIVPFRGKIK